MASGYISLLQQSYKKLLVVLGVYRGTEPWDIRPVFLNPEAENALFVMRVLEPDVSVPDYVANSWGNLPKLLGESYAVTGSSQISSGGLKTLTVYWSLRRYCPLTLNDPLQDVDLEALSSKASSSCISIMQQLSELELRAAEHGHVTKSNIGIFDGKLLLLDPWFYAARSGQATKSQDTLSVRSYASLFLNLFGAHLDQNLILAFQKILSSEVKNQNFRDLLLECGEIQTTRRGLDQAPVESVPPVKDISSATNKNIESFSIPKNSGIAPSGRIITPRPAMKNAVFQNKTQNIEESQPGSEKIPEATTISSLERFKNLFPQYNRAAMFFAVAMIASIIVMISSKAMRFSPSRADVIKLQEDWESDSAPRRRAVAQAALEDGDTTAQEVIELDFLAGNNRAGTNPNFIRIAFNQLWRDELTSEDEIFAFSLALAGVYRIQSNRLPDLPDVHPGVLLALLGDLSLQGGEGKFSAVTTEKLSKLPGAYGTVFSELKKLGIDTFEDVSARAAARIITGATDQDTFDAFIRPDSNPEDAELRLTSIVPFCEMHKELAKLIITSLAARNDYLGQRIKWFVEDPIAQWNQVNENTLVYITIGFIPENLDSFERTVDLLTFPLIGIRKQASLKLLEMLGKPHLAGLLAEIVTAPNRLSRSQTLALLATTRVPAEKVAPFLASWLSSTPDPQIVLQFLLASREQRAYEAVFVQLANYLARSEVEISMKDLTLLLGHPEPLARALAFPRLDASNPLERKILEAWLKSESSQRLKEQLQLKLDAVTPEL